MDENEEVDMIMETINIQNEAREQAMEESLAFYLASKIMEEFNPGAIVVISPDNPPEEGETKLPTDIGIAINPLEGFTKTVLARILRVLADSLDAEMNEFERQINE